MSHCNDNRAANIHEDLANATHILLYFSNIQQQPVAKPVAVDNFFKIFCNFHEILAKAGIVISHYDHNYHFL